MPSQPKRLIQHSILDRLIDNDPGNRLSEAPSTPAQSLRQLKAAVRRDLECLLNARATIVPLPEGCLEVKASMMVYGLPDITSIALESGQDEKRLLRTMEATVARFEPRLTNVKITALQPLTKRTHALRFQIEGLLLVEPAPELISFDAVLDTARGDYHVEGS
jgi:type VI secretion system protein ImpF